MSTGDGPRMATGSAPTVAVASVGDPRSPGTWSGVTVGAFNALCELGVTTRALDLTLPPGLEQAALVAAATATRNRYDAHGAALTMSLRSLLARRRLQGADVDGVIQIGTTVTLPRGVPHVTLEDMTLRQGSTAHPVFSRMSARGTESWERRRAHIYGQTRMCAVASHWAAESLRADYGLPPARIAVVGFGANHRVNPAERVWDPPRFLFVGIDWQRKGGPLVLRAFSRLRREHPDAVLDVVGGHPPLGDPGVTGHGKLWQTRAGDRQRIAELFSRATCLVMPSRVEPFGIVHVEAAAAGVPSIGSSVGGARDAIGADGGLVVNPTDEDALLQAMLRLADAETARRMGEAARERSGLYTWMRVAERLLRALGLPAPDGRALAELL
jgi:glycosyltransferase involved in cell wall biosynthesis